MRPKFQLGHVFSDMDRIHLLLAITIASFGFNWATSFQTWIGDMLEMLKAWRAGDMFQLGHVFSDMDSVTVMLLGYQIRPVSIGPRLFRHG